MSMANESGGWGGRGMRENCDFGGKQARILVRSVINSHDVTWVIANIQNVSLSFIPNKKWVINCISCLVFKSCKINSQYILATDWQTMNLIQTKPKFTRQISKSIFVVSPVSVKVNRTIHTSLEPSNLSQEYSPYHISRQKLPGHLDRFCTPQWFCCLICINHHNFLL